uniref:Uncharacterized protein n=1 Tax=Palpitomonas bilix TaxID=652834 RepID=A0A7S3DF64_9EUKA|mmetsp:Transcript_34342/g.88781  ORF Transcript_34342/g.88781 Transcript_34342/m.88781 type:complete len:483 (+) Transcript_34342:190-1638(+)
MGKQLVFLTFALLFSSALSTSPGLEVTISEGVLSNAWQAGVKVALPHLQSLSIPKTSGKTKTSVGTFAYSVSDIKVTKLKCKSTSAKLKSGEGVDLSASGLTLTVTLKFSFKEESWPHIKTGASATVKVKDGSATLVGLPSSTKDGHLRLSLSKRSVSLGDFDISVDGSMSWLHNFVESLFKSEIKSECEKEIESAIDGQIPQLNTYLASLPTQYAIDMWQGSTVTVDYSVVNPPTITSSFMFLDALGGFSVDGKAKSCPYKAPAMPQVASGSDVQVYVADYVENCFLYSLHEGGLLTTTIDDSMVPSSSPIHLNTTDLQGLEPNLYAAYPNMLVEIVVRSTAAPTVHNTVNTTQISAPIALDWYAVLENGTNAFAFTLESNAQMSIDVEVSINADGNIFVTGTLQESSIVFTATKSDIGDVAVAGLNGLVQLGMQLGQTFLNKGYVVPPVNVKNVGNLQFSNPTIQLQEGYALASINADIP